MEILLQLFILLGIPLWIFFSWRSAIKRNPDPPPEPPKPKELEPFKYWTRNQKLAFLQLYKMHHPEHELTDEHFLMIMLEGQTLKK